MTTRPLSSTRFRVPFRPERASVTAASTSAGVCALSSTSSRDANCTPILTSTCSSSAVGTRVRYRCTPPRLVDRRDGSRVRLAMQREAGDAPPRQGGEEPFGVLLGYLAAAGEPELGGRDRGTDEPGGEQLGGGAADPGVPHDRLGDRVDAQALHPVDPFPYRRLVAQVALQYEPERLALVADELEVRADRAGHPFLVVGRGGHRTADLLHECVAVRVQKSQI